MLDLGVWTAIQHVVETKHRGQRTEKEALWRTCKAAWDEFDPQKLTNVFERWKKVLDLIIEDEGGNGLVESKRGKLFSAPSAEAETPEFDDDEAAIEAAEIGAIEAEE